MSVEILVWFLPHVDPLSDVFSEVLDETTRVMVSIVTA